MFWCYWDNASTGCKSIPITNVSDCLLVTRTITTTSVGSGLEMEIVSRTYLKPGYNVVKQDISILWEDMPWVSTSESPFSILEYKAPNWYHPGKSATIKLGNTIIGFIGEISPMVLNKYEIKVNVSDIQSKYKCEFDCSMFKTEYVAKTPKINVGILNGKTINRDKVFVFFDPKTKADAIIPKRVKAKLPTIRIKIIFKSKFGGIFSNNNIIGVMIIRGRLIEIQ